MPKYAALLVLLSACACSSDDEAAGANVSDAGFDPEPVPGSECGAVIQRHPIEGAGHVPDCSVVDYATNPPSSGDHYGTWPSYRAYSEPVPHGFLVHALEHGALVLFYDCPDGCADEVASAQSFVEGLPADPRCSPPVLNRAIVTPDPQLDGRWAAAAWGVTLHASCFEELAFREFYEAHYGRGPENVCADGQDVIGADGGLEAWCARFDASVP